MKTFLVACILLVSSSPLAFCATSLTSPVAEYRQFLDGLDKKDPASITRAVGRYYELFPSCDQAIRNEGCLEFISFYDQNKLDSDFVEQLLSRCGEHLPTDSNLLKRQPELLHVLEPYGLTLFPGPEAGIWCVSIRKGFMGAVFGSQVSGSIRRYIEYRDIEIAELIQCDAGFDTPYREVADRIGRWSTYIQDYPNSRLNPSARMLISIWSLFLFQGLDNSYVFAGDTLDPEVRKACEWLVQKYPKIFLVPLVKDYLAVLRQNDMRLCDATSTLQKKLLESCGIPPLDGSTSWYVDHYEYAPCFAIH